MPRKFPNLSELLLWRAEHNSGQTALTFLEDGEHVEANWTYEELAHRACSIAAFLQQSRSTDRPVLLLFPPGLDFIAAFWGCVAAGAIAVPVYPPRSNRNLVRLKAIIQDSQALTVFTTKRTLLKIKPFTTNDPQLAALQYVATDDLAPDLFRDWKQQAINGESIAFLQYTSGSTGTPKGVAVSHSNLLENEALIQETFRQNERSVIVGWLPLYHDMGLIGNMLQPIFVGGRCILMPPMAFLQQPFRWLNAITRYRATTSGGPNFAYDLCVSKITDEEEAQLDLSSWQVAFNGAEPVRSATLKRFAARFSRVGFNPRAFTPCYGLAEATLLVSGRATDGALRTLELDASALARNRVRHALPEDATSISAVSCGAPAHSNAVLIVDPESLLPRPVDHIGEIWVSGPSVAQGYWNLPTETEQAFRARIPASSDGPFLRTGDLGFLHDGELFVTGRLKDLIIIRGRNYYPQDIEETMGAAHPALRAGAGAAFAIEQDGEEQLVVVQEAGTRSEDELAKAIQLIARNVAEVHELTAHAIVLVRAGTIPKTSSGKLQRHACKTDFLNQNLYVLKEWRDAARNRQGTQTILSSDPYQPSAVETWVIAEVARRTNVAPGEVDVHQPLIGYGLNSLTAVELCHEVQNHFSIEIAVSDLFDGLTVADIGKIVSSAKPLLTRSRAAHHSTSPLSHGQRALWFIHQAAPESAAYNISRAIRITSPLDVEALRGAFQALVDRHPVLRTSFMELAGEPVQVAGHAQVCFEYFDARNWSTAELEKAWIEQSYRPFSLTHGSLLRTNLYALPTGDHLLHVAVHHIVADYWSLILLLEELGKLYEGLHNKTEAELAPLKWSYSDFVEWQREKLSGPEGERLSAYWKQALSGELAPLSLPADHARPPVETFRGSSIPFTLDAKLAEKLKQLASDQQTTLFATLLAAFQVFLHRLTSQKEIVIGCPAAGRSRAEFADTIGYFVNPLPLRADFQENRTFIEFLSQIRNRISKAFAHDSYPFSLMVEQLGIARDPSVPPIFQSMFVFQQTYGNRSGDFVRFALGQPQAQIVLGGLQLESVAIEQRTVQFDLTLMVGESPEGLVGSWEYSSDLFDKVTIARWADIFPVLLEGIVATPEIAVSQLPILSRREREKLIEELNRTELEYDSHHLLDELIEKQAGIKPLDVAIVCGEAELNYGELNRRADQVARYLERLGVREEDLVAICMNRSPEMVIAMLGVWKARAAYVPLDPQYPQERLRFMLEDAGAKVVITEEDLREKVETATVKVLCLDKEKENVEKESTERSSRRCDSRQVAYLIYTSGSSGVPKGVMLSHRNAMSFVAWAKRAFTQEELSGVLASTSVCFDLSIFELWATLGCGGTVVLANDVLAWREGLKEGKNTNRVRLVNTVPSAISKVIEQGPLPEGVLTVNLAGEALKDELVAELWRAGNLKRINNLYGPTETTTYSTLARVEPQNKVTIGQGVGNTQLYVLDKELELAPLGAIGELYIAGTGVGHGYWKRATLTAERFLPDPYGKTAGKRMYRTGDLVRWNNAGQMEYLGRADQQVKVRGYRIELGEIEASLSGHPAVRENAVVVKENGSDRQVVAYAAPRPGTEIKEEHLREYLQERLPRYMVPTQFVLLERLPKTPNGKIDRKALPDPTRSAIKGRAPQTELEEVVAAIWAQVIRLDRVGAEENFFDLGGHSLLAVQVMSRIRQVLGVELPLRCLLENPTVAGVALQIERTARTDAPPLRLVPRDQRLRLSYAQERLWFLSRYEKEASLYNVPVVLRVKGPLNKEALRASLQEIVNRHEALRTSFPQIDGEAIQAIAPVSDLALPTQEIAESELEEFLRQQARLPFDLATGPVIRGSLVQAGSQDHVLVVVLHHIVCDGWSLGIMLQELNECYLAFSQGAASPLAPLPVQYADFAEWQREWLQGERVEKQTAYWKAQLAGVEPLNLPTDRPYAANPVLSGALQVSLLPQVLTGELRSFSRQQGVTLFMTLLTAFKILVRRYSGQTDVSIGTPVANRVVREVEPLIGFFVNTLALRTASAEDSSVAELLSRVREVSLQAYAHQDVPFERLVEILDPTRNLSRTPLFQTMFVLQNTPLPQLAWDGLETSLSVLHTGTSKFDLTLAAREIEGQLELSLEYSTELFDKARMERLLQHYRSLLEGVVVSVQKPANEIEILSSAEKTQLLMTWNQTAPEYEREKCLPELLEEQARKTPEAVALVSAERELTYSELNRHANQIAHYLRKLGVGPEVRVGICMERGWEMVAGMIGVLKAGGAYVPLDGSYPEERLGYMVEDSEAAVVLSHEPLLEKLSGYGGRVVLLDREREKIGQESDKDLERQTTPENLAYLIYTSGSTGKPKGVAIAHRSAVILMHWARESFAAEDLSAVLASTSVCFDLSIFEIFVPLACGGTVFVVKDALGLANMSGANRVKLVNTVPSAMRELLRIQAVPESVRTINLAGEALTWGLVQDIYNLKTVQRVCNLYGPSEDTTYSTYAWLARNPGSSPVPIGRPIANTQAYVLDRGMRPLPVGVVGELYLGGAGLARGYLNRPNLTAERFVPNPFSTNGERLYRTGDLVSYRADGNLDFLGRIDHQVKIRGYRIELTEIEAALEATEGVKHAVVMAPERSGEKRLAAYVAVEAGSTVAGLQASLKKRLPVFMVPSDFVLLDQLPLTPNGKVDRRALASLTTQRDDVAGHVELRTQTEELVAQIWTELLGVQRISALDHFFALGGHSLMATRMLSRLRQVFGHDIELRTVFEFPVLRDLSAFIDSFASQVKTDSLPPIVPVDRSEALPLSSQQESLWFLDRYSSSGAAYNLPAAVRLKGDLDIEALRLGFQEIVRRHEILRAKFVQVGPKPQLQICEDQSFELPELDLRDASTGVAAEEDVTRERADEAACPFLLSEGGLFRARLLRVAEQEYILLVTIHHIVFDGWSVGVLVNELSALYEAYSHGKPSPLTDLEIQYADYSAWQRKMLEGGGLKEGLEYWKKQLRGTSVLDLPVDYARPAVQSFRGTTEEWRLPAELNTGLKSLGHEHGVTLFMTLLAGFQILLARYSRQEDIAVGSPIANRVHPQLAALIGFFMNTIVLRANMGGRPQVGEVLGRTRETCLAAYAHQAVPLEKLVDELEPHRDPSQNPLFQVGMVLQNAGSGTMNLPGFEMAILPPAASGAKFDLSLIMEESPEGLHGFAEYSTDLFERETIRQMLRHFNQVLHEMVRDPKLSIAALPLLLESERRQILYDWNRTTADISLRCIHELFEEQAERTPQMEAVRHDGHSLSYEELNCRANQLASYVRSLGVGPEMRVAVCMGRRPEVIVAILGVLKAGGAYVPLDPKASPDQLGALLEAAQPIVLLTQKTLASSFLHYTGITVLLDEQWPQISEQSARNSGRSVPENLACVFYRLDLVRDPIGVGIQHSNAVAMLQWARTAFAADDLSQVLASTSVDLSESLFEMFTPLCNGGTLFLTDDAFDPAKIAEYSQTKLIQMPPSAVRELVRIKGTAKGAQTIILTREAASPATAQKIYERNGIERLFNHYAQPEHTGYATQALLPRRRPRRRENGGFPIGKPVMNIQAYVLDQLMEPVPIGVTGELCLAGATVARGYLNHPDVTASRFVPHPFSGKEGERLYRTGDMVRYRPDGMLELMDSQGRQIKLRGRRIELNQIEGVIQQQPGVEDTVVALQATDNRLVAYIVPSATADRSVEQKWRENLRAQLKRILPEYMVPSELVLLERMPLRSDGRLDRMALPVVEFAFKFAAQGQRPLDETEAIIADIWKQVLHLDEVDVESSFFEIGGNSLMVPAVHTALESAFGVNLQIVELLQYRTIRSLAERLKTEQITSVKVESASLQQIVETGRQRPATRELAIVGMVCRLPGCNNAEEYWNNLAGGVESIIDLTDDELRAAGVSEEELASPLYIKRAAIVDNPDFFDARFFDISAREAELIDPQQRIFLECSWEALENAGYTPKNFPGKIGVYAGSGPQTYLLNLVNDANSLYTKDAGPVLFANGADFIATRASYKLDLTGPSLTVQTACSTSLTAVHMACQALLNHECDMAMAGGITVRTPQRIGEVYQEGGILSPDGHCRAFDARARGTVRGNGIGIVVLKRLQDAIRDGDNIRAVIKGSAINNDGANKVSYTAPSIVGQREVIQKALLEAGVNPETVTYVEAHGTSTELGDPIEVTALTQAFRGFTGKSGYCVLGSVKSNIGHSDAAAGVAGLIKTALALEHRLIPPTLHFEQPNPKIDFAHSPFYVNAKPLKWTTENGPRRAGVSSLGIGGTNCHVIVEEAPADDSISSCRPWQLVLLSTKTATALEAATANLEAYLRKNDSVSLANIAHTLQIGRATFNHRCFAVAEGVTDAVEILKGREAKSLPGSVVSRESCRVAFLFPGQGSQYVNMGKHLYAHEPLFRELVDQCSELLQPSLQFDMRSVLYPNPENYEWAEAELRETRTTQPALFVIEYALGRLWMSWGIQPDAMLGHSIGEYVAACLAGVFSLEDALKLVAVRGRLMHSCPRGGMLAAAASEEELQKFLGMGLELAAINGSRSCVLTGPLDIVDVVEKEMAQQQVVHRRLQSSHAFHSAMMEPIIGQFTAEVQKVRLNAPRIKYLSNLTGNWITAEQATDSAYWGKQLRGTVQFAKGIQNVCDGPERVTLEVGPGHTNMTAVRQTIAKSDLPVMLTSLPDSHPGESDVKHILATLGHLWLNSAKVDWNAFAAGEKRKRIPLPTYPFERRRYWVEPSHSRTSRPDVSRKKLDQWLYLPSWKETARIYPATEAVTADNATVLMFAGNSGMAAKLALRLTQKQYNIVTVVAGREFARIDNRTYAIHPASRDDYDALFSVLREQGQLPRKVLHLWNVGSNESIEQDLDLAFYSPLHLIQAATADSGIGPLQCTIVSSGLHEITGNESLSPAKSTLLGLCRTTPRELPEVVCKSVDIDVPAEGSWIEQSLLDQLVAELETKAQQSTISYRRGQRWIHTFEPAHFSASGPDPVRERGVYLITGGLTGIGFHFAEWLATEAQAALVLVDTSPFPPREQWNNWAETHVDDPTVKQINRIRAWEEKGAKVLIFEANIADRGQMRKLHQRVREAWGKIDGVIHAAAVSKKAPIASKTRNDIAAVLAPKIDGALVLCELLAEDDLDFMVFCSSLVAVVGEAEQADYAAANAFLDSLARREFFRSRCFTLSINWDAWNDPDQPALSSANGIKPEEAVAVLRRLLRSRPGPQAIISTRDLELVARLNKTDAVEEEAPAERLYERPNLDRPMAPPSNATEILLVRIWTEVLGVSPIGIDDDFFELGGDSLIGLKVTARTRDLGIPVSIEQLFKLRTVRELALAIEEAKLSGGSATTSQSLEASGVQTPPIRRVARTQKLALSYGQERLWFISQLEPDNVAYNMPDAIRVKGPLDVNSLERTLQEVVRRHESLRTRFVSAEGEALQVIDENVVVEIPVTELGHLPESEREAEALRMALYEARQPFDLANGPVFRVKLLRLAGEDHVLVFNMHHIVSDQWSMAVLVREVSVIYNSFAAGKPSPLPEMDIQYADFSAWQRELLSGPLLEKQLSYWKQKLGGIEPLALPTDRPRPPIQGHDGAIIDVALPRELSEALKLLSRKQGATVYMILLGAFQALLSRYTGQFDIAVGSPIAGRSKTEAEGLIGFFVNTLVMRADLSNQPDSITLLRQVMETTLEAYANQDMPFEKLVEVLLPQRDLSRSPLFQVMFVLQNVPWTELQWGTAKILPFEITAGSAQFEISLVLGETDSGLEGFVEYSTDLFEAASIERMIGHYRMLLSGIVANPAQSIVELPLLGTEERQQILEAWNRTTVAYPQGKFVPDLIEEQAHRTPQAIAVDYEGQALNYQELNARANQLARHLQQLGVGWESRVGVMMERSLEMVVSLVAVLKAGAAYVPLDPDYPAERLGYM
ncbi:MAG TPA: amino acid adenylation domain-containing protein, partial [Candidatus Angelobacter sp.]|nr:amino acid adenylation domain-containing protein [Candidatus Angelobacter sp.]